MFSFGSPPPAQFRCILEIRFVNPDMILVGCADFSPPPPPPPRWEPRGTITLLEAHFFLCWSLLCRRRGAVHHAGHTHDDGGVVDVRAHRHLLLHGQPRRLPHHHAHRELHPVSIPETPVSSQQRHGNRSTFQQPFSQIRTVKMLTAQN